MKKLIKAILPKDLVFEIKLNLRRRKYKEQLKQTFDHYKKVETKIKHRGGKLRVGAYVVYDSTFGACTLFDLMLAQPKKYDVRVVVIPDVSRGISHQKQQYLATKQFFEKRFGSQFVADGYNLDTGEFLDYSLDFDVIYCANPYDSMVNQIHGVCYLSTRECLPIYISYGCMPDKYGCKVIMPMLEMSLFWKVFADNVYSFKDYKRFELSRGKNVVLSGYAKMDRLVDFEDAKSEKKRIIIAPHHSVNLPALPLSNFLNSSDFILELPKKYPDIQFVFRPHPLLFTNMVNKGFWTQEQVDEYILNIKKQGMMYSVGGDYLQVFVNSDAIIHDCSSFVVEYLYTGKPCCFFAKKNYKNIFSKLGKLCLKNYYLAFDHDQICNFIDNVVLKNEDPLKKKREEFFKELAIYYPNASNKILEQIGTFVAKKLCF